jgi:uncharacterized membrane protein
MRLTVGRILGVLLATSLLSTVAWAHEPIDLGTLPGYTVGRAKGINERGDVVGQAGGPGVLDQGILWHKRVHRRYVPEALAPLPGFDRSDARDFAGGRVPIGYSYGFVNGVFHSRAVLWRREPGGARVAVDLEPPPGFVDARAFSGSLEGQVVGEALNGPTRHAVSWRLGRDGVDSCDLGVPEGFDSSAASGVNAAGDVVGTASRMEIDDAGQPQVRSEVVVWLRPHRRSGECAPQPFVLGGRDDLNYKLDPSINERGDVVVKASSRNGNVIVLTRPLGWARCGSRYRMPFEIPVPEGFQDAWASDLNSRGEIVGVAQRPGSDGLLQSQGVRWRYEHWRWRVTLLANPVAGAFVSTEQISEGGAIVGTDANAGLVPGQSGALLWPADLRRPDGDHDRDCREGRPDGD